MSIHNSFLGTKHIYFFFLQHNLDSTLNSHISNLDILNGCIYFIKWKLEEKKKNSKRPNSRPEKIILINHQLQTTLSFKELPIASPVTTCRQQHWTRLVMCLWKILQGPVSKVQRVKFTTVIFHGNHLLSSSQTFKSRLCYMCVEYPPLNITMLNVIRQQFYILSSNCLIFTQRQTLLLRAGECPKV